MEMKVRTNRWLLKSAVLSEQEKKAIHDPKDYPIFSFIKSLFPDERKKIDKVMRVKDAFLSHYNQTEKTWISDCRLYTDQNLRKEGLEHSPDIVEGLVVREILQGDLGERFKLYYGAKYPKRMNFSDSEELSDFLEEIEIAKAIN